MRRLVPLLALITALAAAPASANPVAVHMERNPTIRRNVHLQLNAPALPDGGYYYAVIVLRPYRHYTRSSPPPCSTSSDMQRTDYGYPARGSVALALTPAGSLTHHWCSGGSYEGAVYAVPHAPPCESTYPCESEPYKPPSPCWNIEGRQVCGLVALRSWHYPDPLPKPLATGTTISARFSVRFPL
ncbi:MAG: hypothetical protein ACLQBB_02190 [Solirubrobacteraceae bacterium]